MISAGVDRSESASSTVPADGMIVIKRGLASGTNADTDSRVLGRLERPEDVERFHKAIQDAMQKQGILDVSMPDYEAELELEGKPVTVYLWLDSNSDQGMVIYSTDTHTGYRVTIKSTTELKNLIGQL